MGQEPLALIDHTSRVHSQHDLFVCEFCALYNASSSLLQHHIRDTHSVSTQPSVIISEQSKDLAALISDMKSQMEEKLASVSTKLLDKISCLETAIIQQGKRRHVNFSPDVTIHQVPIQQPSVQPPEPQPPTQQPEQPVPVASLFVGSSIGHNMDFHTVQKLLGHRLDKLKAYSCLLYTSPSPRD